MSKKHVVVSLSGGMDSSTLLLRCLKEYDSVTAISFDYGQKHRVELERAQSLVKYINTSELATGKKWEYIPINYRQIKLDGLAGLLDSALVTGGKDVPEGHYESENMKETVVPNRNKMFVSITQAVALSVVNRTEETCSNDSKDFQMDQFNYLLEIKEYNTLENRINNQIMLGYLKEIP